MPQFNKSRRKPITITNLKTTATIAIRKKLVDKLEFDFQSAKKQFESIAVDANWLKYYRKMFTAEGYIFHAIALDRKTGIFSGEAIELDADVIHDFMFRWDLKDYHKTKTLLQKLGTYHYLTIETQLVLNLNVAIAPPTEKT